MMIIVEIMVITRVRKIDDDDDGDDGEDDGHDGGDNDDDAVRITAMVMMMTTAMMITSLSFGRAVSVTGCVASRSTPPLLNLGKAWSTSECSHAFKVRKPNTPNTEPTETICFRLSSHRCGSASDSK